MSEFFPITVPPGASNEALNEALFKRPEIIPPAFSGPNQDGFDGVPPLETTDELVATILAKNREQIANAEQEGIPTPCLSIIAGSVFGESRDHVLSAVLDYQRTGEVPAGFGDGMSYINGSLLPNAAASGVQIRLFLPHELATHETTQASIRKAGLNPDTVITTGHDLGYLLSDLGPLVERLHYLERWNNEYIPLAPQLPIARTNPTDDSTGQSEGFAWHIKQELQEVNDAINERLAKEDAKIRALVMQENERETTDAVIVIMPPYTSEGDKLIRDAMDKPEKDIDGLGTGERWDPITSNAALRTLDYLAHKFIGRSVPAKKLALLGLGKLVGRRINELARPGTVIDGRNEIAEWSANPGKKHFAGAILAHRGAESFKADLVHAAHWGRFALGLYSPVLLVVDVGSVTTVNEQGERTTVGNLDPRSLPPDHRVIATGARHGVGPVTGALAMERTIAAASERFHRKISSGTTNKNVSWRQRLRRQPQLIS